MTLSKRRKIYFPFLFLMLLIFTSCALPWTSQPNTSVVEITPPVVEPQDLSPFQNIGCVWQNDNYAICPKDSIPNKMGCDSLSTAPEFLGLLDQKKQFVVCSYVQNLSNIGDDPEPKSLWKDGCKNIIRQRVLTYDEGDYLLIRDIEDLKYYFSPISNPDQALGYAITATGYSPRFDLENLKGYRILTDQLQETNVAMVNNGYEMSLFSNQLCGCGPHTTYQIKVKVTSNGDILLIDSIPAFENPDEDHLCVD